jgi:hypothetical protein
MFYKSKVMVIIPIKLITLKTTKSLKKLDQILMTYC